MCLLLSKCRHSTQCQGCSSPTGKHLMTWDSDCSSPLTSLPWSMRVTWCTTHQTPQIHKDWIPRHIWPWTETLCVFKKKHLTTQLSCVVFYTSYKIIMCKLSKPTKVQGGVYFNWFAPALLINRDADTRFARVFLFCWLCSSVFWQKTQINAEWAVTNTSQLFSNLCKKKFTCLDS